MSTSCDPPKPIPVGVMDAFTLPSSGERQAVSWPATHSCWFGSRPDMTELQDLVALLRADTPLILIETGAG